MSVDLGGKDLEDRRKRSELLSETENGFPGPTFHKFCTSKISTNFKKWHATSNEHTLEEQWQERDHENQENTDDTAPNPVKDRNKVITTLLATNHLTRGSILADPELRVQGTQEDH